jgi:hypothetical protein
MKVCCQNLTLGALSSPSALSVLVGAVFKKFDLFLNTPFMLFNSWFNKLGYKIYTSLRLDISVSSRE